MIFKPIQPFPHGKTGRLWWVNNLMNIIFIMKHKGKAQTAAQVVHFKSVKWWTHKAHEWTKPIWSMDKEGTKNAAEAKEERHKLRGLSSSANRWERKTIWSDTGGLNEADGQRKTGRWSRMTRKHENTSTAWSRTKHDNKPRNWTWGNNVHTYICKHGGRVCLRPN